MIKTWWMMEIDSEKYGNLSQKSEFEFTFLLNDSSETSAANFDLPRMSKNKEKDSEQHMKHKSHTLFMSVL